MRLKSTGFLIVIILSMEIVLRIFTPGLADDLFSGKAKTESPFIYNEKIGYEFKPFAVSGGERLNNEGFRGPEYTVPKPEGVFRILVIGDSVAYSLNSYDETWEKLLEKKLNYYISNLKRFKHCEVINAGIGGYVSWQALARLKTRGLKYQPDLVLLLVGWNDMLYSAMPYWTPEMNLTKIEASYSKDPGNAQNKTLFHKARIFLYRRSYVARLVREIRNYFWNSRRISNHIRQHQLPSGRPFNESALKLYQDNLEEIYRTVKSRGARLGVIIYPTILRPDALNDPDIHKKLLMFYMFLPQSTRELWYGYNRYINVMKEFSLRHGDIMLIDAAEPFAAKNKNEHKALFYDLNHPNVEGNRILAEAVFKSIVEHNLSN